MKEERDRTTARELSERVFEDKECQVVGCEEYIVEERPREKVK